MVVLAYVQRKMARAEKLHSRYDRKLLAICISIRHFQHCQVAENVKIDYKPSRYALCQKSVADAK